jgi:hypothetical protein
MTVRSVLRPARDDYEVEIKYNARNDGGCYWIYGYVLKDCLPVYTRLAAIRCDVQRARDLAARAWPVRPKERVLAECNHHLTANLASAPSTIGGPT